MGEGTNGGHDPFDELRAAGFFDDAPHEPSAEERARAAARRARAADLQRRLAEEAEHERRLAERDRKLERKRRRAVRSASAPSATTSWRSYLVPAVIVLAFAGAVWFTYGRQGGDPLAQVAVGPTTRPPDYPPIDDTVAEQPLGTPPPAPADPGEFEFISTQDEGADPVTWDPCRPIRYVVNTDGAPPGADALIRDAIARTSAATGLVFVGEGTTTEPWRKDRDPYQPDRYGEQWAPALIAWSNENETPGLAGYIAGLGGPIGRSVPGDGANRLAWVSGSVVLDAAQLSESLAVPGGTDSARSVIQHELGHMVGLDHVADPSQLMFSESKVDDWGTGDLAGLHALGTGACFPEL